MRIDRPPTVANRSPQSLIDEPIPNGAIVSDYGGYVDSVQNEIEHKLNSMQWLNSVEVSVKHLRTRYVFSNEGSAVICAQF